MSEAKRKSACITQEAANWHALQRQEDWSRTQQARFMDWLVASPEHLREYLAISRIAGELGETMRGMAIDLDALIGGDLTRSAPDNVVALPFARSLARSKEPPRHRTRLLRIAAAAAILLSLSVGMYLSWPQSGHYVAEHGAPRTFELPDGTVVHLNAESALSMRFTLLGRRIELARGQASFIVAHDRRPLAVHAAGLQIRDIGTTFDVSLQREQARISVSEGRVRIVSDSGEGRRVADVRAGQSAQVDYLDHSISVSHDDVETMTAWWQGRIVFRDEPLRDVADRFNRMNAVRLYVQDAAAGALRLTGNLSAHDLDSLRAFLEAQPTLETFVTEHAIQVRTRTVQPASTRRQ
ncbi:FecR domain-containing protein [Steroidobacter sp. S1-65]|uniref:FecR domain-containing protein n=1 Tax=Steroidobacter gossypii TaxID=2805490 RepID=A0ABS1WXZ0_9GAMM|nr:FecR domain-containing protein [Steroidobacter gossypii]MBM0105850.1 FecR domain-containing protein [Steroidobacter gossypii]